MLAGVQDSGEEIFNPGHDYGMDSVCSEEGRNKCCGGWRRESNASMLLSANYKLLNQF